MCEMKSDSYDGNINIMLYIILYVIFMYIRSYCLYYIRNRDLESLELTQPIAACN